MTTPTHQPATATAVPAAEYLQTAYDELRALAAGYLSGERPWHTLQPTALVHEAYLKLSHRPGFESRSDFLAAAGEAMRRLLVDHARKKLADKRGGGAERLPVNPDSLPGRALDPDDQLAVDEALVELAAVDPTAARLAELRLFAGLSVEEAGAALGVSRAAAYRDWTFARAWLSTFLSEKPPSE